MSRLSYKPTVLVAILVLTPLGLVSGALTQAEESKPQPAAPGAVVKADKDRVWEELNQIVQ